MRYKPYPKYKESGVAWLGEVPAHWEVKSLKALLVERKEVNKPIKTKNILSLCMYRGVIPYAEKGNSGNKAKEDLTAYKLAYPNDIVLNSMNVVAGSVGLSKYFGAVSPVYYMLRPRKNEDKVEYFNNIFQSESFQKSLFGLGNGILVKQSESTGKLNTIRMRIPMDKLNTVLLPYPSIKEQINIVNFLDQKTKKIDTLIKKQQSLIELLKEKRQALISHVVTKGLDDSVAMKDSGVEWLGEVPKHWIVLNIKRLCFVKRGASPRPIENPIYFDDNGEYAWVRISDVTLSDMYLEKTVQKLSALGKSLSVPLEPNDLFLSIAGSVGKPIIANIKCCIHDGFVYFQNYKEDLKFLYWVFKSGQPYLGLGKFGTQLNLNKDTVGDIKIALPPLKDQQKIANHLDQKTKQIDTLIEKSTKAIELLKERREALISAVVTGKIDVS